MDFYRKLFQKPGKSPPSLPLTYKVEIDKQKELINKFRQTSLNLEKEFLRQKSINAGSEVIQSFCSAFQEVLLDEFYLDTNEDTYADAESLWKVLSVYIDSTPINFLRGLQKFNQEKDKLNIWILVELFDKSLCSTFLILSKNPELVLRHYNANALIRKEGDQIKEILNRLMHLQYDLYSDFLQKYQEKKEQSPKSELENTNKSLEEEKEHEKEQENIDENQIKENIDRYKKLLESTKEQKQQDDRQSFIREEYKQFLDEKHEHKPFELIRKIWGPKKLRKSTRSKSKVRKISFII